MTDAAAPRPLEFLYQLRPTRLAMLTDGPTPAETAAIGEHFAYLQRLHREGTLVLAGRTLNNDEHTFGIVVLRAPDEATARALMEADPAVVAGVMTAELFPFRVALLGNASGDAVSYVPPTGNNRGGGTHE